MHQSPEWARRARVIPCVPAILSGLRLARQNLYSRTTVTTKPVDFGPIESSKAFRNKTSADEAIFPTCSLVERLPPPCPSSLPFPQYPECGLWIAPKLPRLRSRLRRQPPKHLDVGASSRPTKSAQSDSRFPSLRCRGPSHERAQTWMEILFLD